MFLRGIRITPLERRSTITKRLENPRDKGNFDIKSQDILDY